MREKLSAAAYSKYLSRLNQQSVEDYTLAYSGAIPWDDPEYAVDRTDPRWIEACADTPFARHMLSEIKDPQAQRDFAITSTAHKMKVGMQFENVLMRGLLEFSTSLPNGAEEFRYAHHEIVEEAQHCMMFQEFINRSQSDVKGMPTLILRGTTLVSILGVFSPCLFMFFVLIGEGPIDAEQKKVLKRENIPPILRKILQIHANEESRHIGFAMAYLNRKLPTLAPWRRWLIGLLVPFIAVVMANGILGIEIRDSKKFGIGWRLWFKHARKAEVRSHVARCLQSVRIHCVQLGLMHSTARFFWKLFGIFGENPRPLANRSEETVEVAIRKAS